MNAADAPLVREPIYQQLCRILRDLARSGEFAPGEKFLTEREIASRFNVSRATANKALSSLVSEGALEFRKGMGTYVRPGLIGYDLRALVSFTKKAKAAGKKPSTKVLRFERVDASEIEPEAREALKREKGEVYFLERLRLADRTAMILERRHVVASHCPGLTARDAAASIYEVWTSKFGLSIEGADQSIRAVSIRGKEARQLGVRGGSAGLLVTSTGFLEGGIPLWHEKTLYRGDLYLFENRLGGLTAGSPAIGRLTG